MTSVQPNMEESMFQEIKNAFLLIIFGNKKRWNRGIVNGMQHFLGIGRTGRVFFYLFHAREWNS